MRITVRGWGRDQGEKEIMNAALAGAEPGPTDRYSRDTTYLNVVHPESPHYAKVRVSTSAELRLGGTYLLHVELSRKEIAQLFYATHSGEIVRQFQSFIEDEERARNARNRERRKEIEEQMRAERAAAEPKVEIEPETEPEEEVVEMEPEPEEEIVESEQTASRKRREQAAVRWAIENLRKG